MTTKADFNAEEWTTVVEGPLFAGMKVIAAGRGGTIRESMAMGRVYTHAREQQGENGLLDEIVSSPPALDAKRAPEGTDVGTLTTERLRAALDVVREKATPEELEAYKGFVKSVAEAAAQAHKEGGFLGIGGERVSEAEQAALDDVAATLDG